MAAPCTNDQYAYWNRMCRNVLGQRVKCSSLDAAQLAAGQYLQDYVSPDGTQTCYGGNQMDLGDFTVDNVNGEIVDSYSEVRDGLIFWATVAATGLFLGLGAFLFIRELRKL